LVPDESDEPGVLAASLLWPPLGDEDRGVERWCLLSLCWTGELAARSGSSLGEDRLFFALLGSLLPPWSPPFERADAGRLLGVETDSRENDGGAVPPLCVDLVSSSPSSSSSVRASVTGGDSSNSQLSRFSFS